MLPYLKGVAVLICLVEPTVGGLVGREGFFFTGLLPPVSIMVEDFLLTIVFYGDSSFFLSSTAAFLSSTKAIDED
jgi:hypothetical protein